MHCRRLKNLSGIILDFDGTMSFLFRDYNLTKTAEIMRAEMKKHGVDFDTALDTFDVFGEIAAQIHDSEKRIDVYAAADKILTAAELEAVETSEPVSGVAEALRTIRGSKFKLGIATNNSVKCVEKFLRRLNLDTDFDIPIVGRAAANPELMKPNPWSVLETARLMNIPVSEMIFVGDTNRDYQTSINIGCDFIGLAATERKRGRLLEIIPEERIVADYHELLKYLFE